MLLKTKAKEENSEQQPKNYVLSKFLICPYFLREYRFFALRGRPLFIPTDCLGLFRTIIQTKGVMTSKNTIPSKRWVSRQPIDSYKIVMDGLSAPPIEVPVVTKPIAKPLFSLNQREASVWAAKGPFNAHHNEGSINENDDEKELTKDVAIYPIETKRTPKQIITLIEYLSNA